MVSHAIRAQCKTVAKDSLLLHQLQLGICSILGPPGTSSVIHSSQVLSVSRHIKSCICILIDVCVCVNPHANAVLCELCTIIVSFINA